MAKHARSSAEGKTRKASPFGLSVSAILLLVFLVFWGYVWSTGLAPGLYIGIGALVSAGFTGLVLFLTWSKERKACRVVGIILAALLVFGCVVGGFALWRAVHTVRQISDMSSERSLMAFYTEHDSSIQTISDLNGQRVGILSQLDRPNTEDALHQAETEQGFAFSIQEYESPALLADALRSGEVAGILLNQAFLSLYEELPGYESFASELRDLSTQEVEHVLEHSASTPVPELDEPADPDEDSVITILISGSDTRGDMIDQRGRSDVNIIAKVNRETHKILLLSTPRDYYVPLAFSWGSPEDKLTHAGIYGMDVLMGTLEDLYDTEIDYYFRLNFTGFTEIIDALGGIDVYSDYDFTAGGHDYHVGTNHLDGAEALSFARERYSFTEGDRQRGRNQMAVIEGVLKKAMSPSILTGYLNILQSVQDCVDTSIPYDLIAEVVRQQLSDGANWDIESYSVDGSDASATTYSMAQNLYVMIPDEGTVQEAKTKLTELD